jgi:D-lactate dehydrogenase (cytochrome)
MAPNSKAFTTDVCVPISRLADVIIDTKTDLAELGIAAAIVGHVGDGNSHVIIPVDPNDKAQVERAKILNERLIGRALAADGTCSGEHGIGLGKRDALVTELGNAVDYFRLIKHAIDPHGIMNPGKLI